MHSAWWVTCKILWTIPHLCPTMGLKYVTQDLIDNKTVLVQLISWHLTGNKPLPETMLTKMLATFRQEVTHPGSQQKCFLQIFPLVYIEERWCNVVVGVEHLPVVCWAARLGGCRAATHGGLTSRLPSCCRRQLWHSVVLHGVGVKYVCKEINQDL